MNMKEEDMLENYKVRLRKELVSRDGHSEIDKDTTRFLTFKDKNLEKAYGIYREPFSSVPLTASLLVQIVGVLYSLFVLPRWVVCVLLYVERVMEQEKKLIKTLSIDFRRHSSLFIFRTNHRHRTWLHFTLVLPPTLVIAAIVFISIAESFPGVSRID